MTEKRVDWLLVGSGDIASKRVAPALAGVAPGRLVAVCDPAVEKARELAAQHGVSEVYSDFSEALKKTSANAVYLATPVFLHSAHAADVLASGRHVLVEKPLGVSAADTGRAAQAASENKHLKAGCAYFRRLSPRYRHAAKLVGEGAFGQIVLVRMTYFSWFNPEPDDPKYWRVIRAKSGGGPLSDMGTHMFDVLIGLLGMPSRVCARTKTLVHSYEVEDSSVILMEMGDGADVTASFHWNSKTWSHEFEIIGTESKLKWHPFDVGKVILTRGRDIQELDMPNPENVHLPLVADFVEAVTMDRQPCVTLHDAAATNVLLDAVYRSAETGKTHEVRALS